MLDFIIRIIGKGYRALRPKPREVEINLGGTKNPLESDMHIVHSMMHLLPYNESARRGTVRIPICDDLGGTKNPLESDMHIVHSMMHLLPETIISVSDCQDGDHIANMIMQLSRMNRVEATDQMIMYASNRRKQQKPAGNGCYPMYSKMRDFDDIFADEINKLNTEEEENKDV